MFIEHFDKFVRQIVAPDLSVALFRDGHSSRNGIEWVEEVQKRNIEVLVLPANTTHVLQTCGDESNKTFQRAVRKTRDDLMGLAATNVHANGFKIKLAVAGHAAIIAQNVRESFINTGMWPVDYRFANRMREQKGQVQHVEERVLAITMGRRANQVTSVCFRRSDAETFEDIKRILGNETQPSASIKAILRVLGENQTVSSILRGIRPVPSASGAKSTKNVLGCGAPAAWLMVGNLVQIRKKKQEAARAAAKQKELQREERARQNAVDQKKRVLARLEREELKKASNGESG